MYGIANNHTRYLRQISMSRFTFLLEQTKAALDVMSPLIREFYVSVSTTASASTLKHDNSMFSIADGCVQAMLIIFLREERFKAIVGEEAIGNVNLSVRPYMVNDLNIPERLWDAVDATKSQILALGQQLSQHNFQDVEVFIDPIDGTKEFCSELGEQCTVCVGFAVGGCAHAGMVYRPVPNPATFAAGCLAEKYSKKFLPNETAAPFPGFLTTNGTISPFIASTIQALQLVRVPSGGVGNKVLLLLENHAECYIQDRGVSRWDTCAAEAVLDAHGSYLVKLTGVLEHPAKLQRYTYTQSKANADFTPNLSLLTENNRGKSNTAKSNTLIANVNDVLEYSNLHGLTAFAPAAVPKFDHYHNIMLQVAANEPPTYS
jgi:3'-phosphoadenosine 5'-phosphosulfate (PAPS) 3'-phosphatase